MADSYICWETKHEYMVALENLIGLKRLHDAGYNVKDSPIFPSGSYDYMTHEMVGRYLEIVFGKDNVKYQAVSEDKNDDNNCFVVKDPRFKELFDLLETQLSDRQEQITNSLLRQCRDIINCCSDYYAEPCVNEVELTNNNDGFIVYMSEEGMLANNTLADSIMAISKYLDRTLDELKKEAHSLAGNTHHS